MRKKILIGVVIIIAIAILVGGYFIVIQNQKPATQKIYKVGMISGSSGFANIGDGFKEKMTELGYIEGENIVYDFQVANADPVKESEIVNKFVGDEVDLIFAFPTEPTQIAKEATGGTNIPVVFALADLQGTNLVESVSQPGGNITGVRSTNPDISVKYLEILLELVPNAKRIYITYDKNYPSIPGILELLRSAAESNAIILVESPVANAEEIKTDLDARDKSEDIGMDAILIVPNLLTQSPEGFGHIAQFAIKHNVPVGGTTIFNLKNGSLFSFVPDNIEMGKLGASLANKIFNGIPAGTIPVVTPESYLRINYKRAQELGLTVPEGLLSQAVEIIR